MAKNTTELFRKTAVDSASAKKRSQAQMLDFTDRLGVRKDYLVKHDAMATAVFLSANLSADTVGGSPAKRNAADNNKRPRQGGYGGGQYPNKQNNALQQTLRFLGALA
jgi:hypothetical protein